MLHQLLHHLVVGMVVPLQDRVEGMVVSLLPNRPRPRVEGIIVEKTQQLLLLLLLQQQNQKQQGANV